MLFAHVTGKRERSMIVYETYVSVGMELVNNGGSRAPKWFPCNILHRLNCSNRVETKGERDNRLCLSVVSWGIDLNMINSRFDLAWWLDGKSMSVFISSRSFIFVCFRKQNEGAASEKQIDFEGIYYYVNMSEESMIWRRCLHVFFVLTSPMLLGFNAVVFEASSSFHAT